MIGRIVLTQLSLTLLALLIISGCSTPTEKPTQTQKQEQPTIQKTEPTTLEPPAIPVQTDNTQFKIAERKMLNDALILSVISEKNLNEVEQSIMKVEAEKLVAENSDQYMIRVFFYNPGQTPGTDSPLCRFEWTKEQGLVLDFDKSIPRQKSKPSYKLPKYSILDEVTLFSGGKYGDILITSFSRKTSLDELKSAAKEIARSEGFDEISLYSTKEAFKANFSSSYSESHPNALKNGYLGSYKDGVFTPPFE